MHIIKKEVASTGDIQILGDLDINKNIAIENHSMKM